MRGTITTNARQPSSEILRQLLHGSGMTGTLLPGPVSVRIPFNTTSTGTSNMAWINAEAGTVLAKVWVIWTTAGTGSFSVGRQSDGTGSASDVINLGSMNVGVHFYGTVLGTAAASATLGQVDGEFWLIGPGGTGTNNSIVCKVTDTITSTAAGFMFVQYSPVAGF